MAMTWDMITSGQDAGRVIRPPTLTATEADATRVRVWLRIATLRGSYRMRVGVGLDRETMLDGATTDAERSAEVIDQVLEDPGVEAVLAADARTVDGRLFIAASFLTIDGVTVGITVG